MKSQNCVLATAAALLLTSQSAWSFDLRSIDGSGNNVANSTWGTPDSRLLRLAPSDYQDGISVPRGGDPTSLPSARAISNAVSAQSSFPTNNAGASDWLWQWGQFVDHDIDLTAGATPSEPFNISVPLGDPQFDPFNTGTEEIHLNRSVFDPLTGIATPREQVNQITAYIDASNVYGSDATRAAALRANVDGLLDTTTFAGETMMPLNTSLLDNANDSGVFPDAELFLGGDPRANEQIGLTAAHTLFVREHNRLAADIKQRLDGGEQTLIDKRDAAITQAGNGVTDEDDFIYEVARKVVGAQMQKITYEEFLPVLLGDNALTPFAGYDNSTNAGISNEFSTAAFRVGHTMLSPELQRIDGAGVDQGSVSLQDSFFNPQEVKDNGVDSLLRGLATGQAQAIDTMIIDDVRNFLFGPPGSGGLDLASLNLQRGRDHGIPTLNDTRLALGLTAHGSFLDMTGGDAALAAQFASVYFDVDEVDLWIGGLSESQVNGGLMGETFFTIIADQFTRLRDGDRYFYLEEMNHLMMIDPNFQSTQLSDIIMRNSTISQIQENVFIAIPEPSSVLLALLAAGGLTFAVRRRKSRIAR